MVSKYIQLKIGNDSVLCVTRDYNNIIIILIVIIATQHRNNVKLGYLMYYVVKQMTYNFLVIQRNLLLVFLYL